MVNTIADGQELSIDLTANEEGGPEKQSIDELFQKLKSNILGPILRYLFHMNVLFNTRLDELYRLCIEFQRGCGDEAS